MLQTIREAIREELDGITLKDVGAAIGTLALLYLAAFFILL